MTEQGFNVEIYWGADSEFEQAIAGIKDYNSLADVLNHVGQTSIKIEGIDKENPPLKISNLIIHTDDYGGVNEWALLGFCNNVLENGKIVIDKIWLCNPPRQIYDDIKRTYGENQITEHKTTYPEIDELSLRRIATEYSDVVLGQPNVIKKILPSIYSLKNPNRSRPVTLLFLGDSGVGKTETASFIGQCLECEMVRIQFSMNQTIDSAQYIFGGKHGEDSLARRLIRRNSNLILLDEFDKVAPGYYNAFYQMFDEGVFVDANYTVDVSKCIIICTSNYKSEEDAEQNLGTPILSRFSRIVRFEDISIEDRLKIAQKIYQKLLGSLPDNEKMFITSDKVLNFYEDQIKLGAYPNIRMLKNDMEDALYYEILLSKGIL